MFNKYGRIFSAAIGFTMAIFFAFKGIYVAAVAMLVGVGFVLYGYMKYGTVYLAFRQLRSGKLAEAEKTLNKIKDKNKLSKEHKAYFHFVWGYIYFSQLEHESAITEFEAALDGEFKNQHDKALIYCNLASLYLKTKDKKKAEWSLAEAKKLPYKKVLASDIEAIEEQLQK